MNIQGGLQYLNRLSAVLMMAVLFSATACQGGTTSTPTPPITYSQYQLEYRLMTNFGKVFWCDPDFYPIGRPGIEEKNSVDQFPAIKANEVEFSAILGQLNLPNKAEYTDSEKLLIYREHKLLTYGVQITTSGTVYHFTLRVGQSQGERIEGDVTPSGGITVTKRETSFNTCPICLTRGTLIDTPNGQVPVEQLRQGMAVWTADDSGQRVAAIVTETAETPVPLAFSVMKITLKDGRTVSASPGHPTAEGRALGDYQTGEILDGALVVKMERVAYNGGATYDILPSGTTGLYRANGVLLKSTLASR